MAKRAAKDEASNEPAEAAPAIAEPASASVFGDAAAGGAGVAAHLSGRGQVEASGHDTVGVVSEPMAVSGHPVDEPSFVSPLTPAVVDPSIGPVGSIGVTTLASDGGGPSSAASTPRTKARPKGKRKGDTRPNRRVSLSMLGDESTSGPKAARQIQRPNPRPKPRKRRPPPM